MENDKTRWFQPIQLKIRSDATIQPIILIYFDDVQTPTMHHMRSISPKERAHGERSRSDHPMFADSYVSFALQPRFRQLYCVLAG